MVFYFSGTGNSLWAARQVAALVGGRLVNMSAELLRHEGLLRYAVEADERIFFIFPVHSWGPCIPAMRFVRRLHLDGYRSQPVFLLCTCGDTCGHTDRIMRRLLSRRGIALTQAYSLQMPNNYILMKGFGVDSPLLQQAKLDTAGGRLAAIVDDILSGCPARHYVRGSKPFVKSYLINPLFRHLAVRRILFHSTTACTSCGLCVKACPTRNIVLNDGRPRWGRHCVQCTACINRCPVRAIEYGDVTQEQGRYAHP